MASKGKALRIVLLVLLLLILFLAGGFFLLEAKGKKEMLGRKDEAVQMTVPEKNTEIQVEDEGDVIYYQGEKYRYNENITSILCMGIDRESWNEGEDEIGTSGQADFLVLAILDVESGSVKLWNISRDSMGEVDIYNVDGEYVRTEEAQICLAYAYGDGKESSCENTVRSVSRLLYGIPIHAYVAIDMDAIQPLNDAVGGVEVTIHEGDILPDHFVPGSTVLLQGKDVESYVRFRMTELPDEPIDSNNNRMARQKQYLMNFIQKILQQTKEDITTPVKLYQIVAEGNHVVTDVGLSKISFLTNIFLNVNFSEDSFQTVPGEVVDGGTYAEYHVDDDALYEMILETFYCKEQ
ncbi:MAG: LCP family protein [Roseburia sp.]|nr:LCP family protein [Roseburia sp.]